ncbi:MAG TPA: right-handed parallel beta-helix repeat-containing protein [Kofleriaceae bacterium]|nr:right-handed parallel beta-helix repeat-containing protein [Kofleriaceae bacterium]
MLTLSLRLAVSSGAFLWLGSIASASPIAVPADQPTIQAAIDAAVTGDVITVAPGTYHEHIQLRKAITVRSAGGPIVTIIDGDGTGTVVRLAANEPAEATFAGFTIRNGRSSDGGAGIWISGSAATVENNFIIDNRGCTGVGVTISFSSPVIRGNTILRNLQTECSGGTGGGGILVGGVSTAQILDNTIADNRSQSGGGISLFAADGPTIRGNVISGNTAESEGGGIATANAIRAVIADNVIVGNAADEGGGIATLVPSGALGPRLINNTIANNTARANGAQLLIDGFPGQTQIWNNVISGATTAASVFCDPLRDRTPPALRFNDLFNAAGPADGGSCTGSVGHDGNISADPLFVDPALDFHLTLASPAVDAGSNTAPFLPATDITGFPRILDGNADGTATVDLGAHELGGALRITLVPTSLTFPGQLRGTTSEPQIVTLTNTGDGPVAVPRIAITNDFTETHTCGTVVARGATCTVELRFAPTAAGPRTGTLTIMDNALGGPHTVALAGLGSDFAIEPAPDGATSATVDAGATATYALQLTALSGFSGPVELACNGAPDRSTCSVTPTSLTAAGAPTAFTVTVTTTAPSLAALLTSSPAAPSPLTLSPDLERWPALGLIAALVALIALTRHRRRARHRFAVPAAVLLTIALGCGGHNSSAPDAPTADAPTADAPTIPGTASGTYELTVTAASGAEIRTKALSLSIR